MPVQFQNFDYTYQRNGKPVFAPSPLGRQIGEDIKEQVEAKYQFDDFVFHLRKKGGHVAALHSHRPHGYFARVDIRRFFYSVARNRVQRALATIGIPRARHYAKWSCVKNPYDLPTYSLPYGFVQSPILASLVLMESAVGSFLRGLVAENHVTVSVYMDDISLSSDDLPRLQAAFNRLVHDLAEARFQVSPAKLRPPGPVMDLFNCDLRQGETVVREERIDLFEAEPQSHASMEAFSHYCLSVEKGNTMPTGAAIGVGPTAA